MYFRLWKLWTVFCVLLGFYRWKFSLQESSSPIVAHINIIGPALAECLKDGSTPVRLAAERCALHAFQLSKGTFSAWFVYCTAETCKVFQWSSSWSKEMQLWQCFCWCFAGPENVQAAQKFITGLDARRISKFPEHRYISVLWRQSMCCIFSSQTRSESLIKWILTQMGSPNRKSY